jgi:hypothetical protein
VQFILEKGNAVVQSVRMNILSSVSTTMIYLHVMKPPGAGARSPLDFDGATE